MTMEGSKTYQAVLQAVEEQQNPCDQNKIPMDHSVEKHIEDKQSLKSVRFEVESGLNASSPVTPVNDENGYMKSVASPKENANTEDDSGVEQDQARTPRGRSLLPARHLRNRSPTPFSRHHVKISDSEYDGSDTKEGKPIMEKVGLLSSQECKNNISCINEASSSHTSLPSTNEEVPIKMASKVISFSTGMSSCSRSPSHSKAVSFDTVLTEKLISATPRGIPRQISKRPFKRSKTQFNFRRYRLGNADSREIDFESKKDMEPKSTPPSCRDDEELNSDQICGNDFPHISVAEHLKPKIGVSEEEERDGACRKETRTKSDAHGKRIAKLAVTDSPPVRVYNRKEEKSSIGTISDLSGDSNFGFSSGSSSDESSGSFGNKNIISNIELKPPGALTKSECTTKTGKMNQEVKDSCYKDSSKAEPKEQGAPRGIRRIRFDVLDEIIDDDGKSGGSKCVLSTRRESTVIMDKPNITDENTQNGRGANVPSGGDITLNRRGRQMTSQKGKRSVTPFARNRISTYGSSEDDSNILKSRHTVGIGSIERRGIGKNDENYGDRRRAVSFDAVVLAIGMENSCESQDGKQAHIPPATEARRISAGHMGKANSTDENIHTGQSTNATSGGDITPSRRGRQMTSQKGKRSVTPFARNRISTYGSSEDDSNILKSRHTMEIGSIERRDIGKNDENYGDRRRAVSFDAVVLTIGMENSCESQDGKQAHIPPATEARRISAGHMGKANSTDENIHTGQSTNATSGGDITPSRRGRQMTSQKGKRSATPFARNRISTYGSSEDDSNILKSRHTMEIGSIERRDIGKNDENYGDKRRAVSFDAVVLTIGMENSCESQDGKQAHIPPATEARRISAGHMGKANSMDENIHTGQSTNATSGGDITPSRRGRQMTSQKGKRSATPFARNRISTYGSSEDDSNILKSRHTVDIGRIERWNIGKNDENYGDRRRAASLDSMGTTICMEKLCGSPDGQQAHVPPAAETGRGRTESMGKGSRRRSPTPFARRRAYISTYGLEDENDIQKEASVTNAKRFDSLGGSTRSTRSTRSDGKAMGSRFNSVQTAYTTSDDDENGLRKLERRSLRSDQEFGTFYSSVSRLTTTPFSDSDDSQGVGDLSGIVRVEMGTQTDPYLDGNISISSKNADLGATAKAQTAITLQDMEVAQQVPSTNTLKSAGVSRGEVAVLQRKENNIGLGQRLAQGLRLTSAQSYVGALRSFLGNCDLGDCTIYKLK